MRSLFKFERSYLAPLASPIPSNTVYSLSAPCFHSVHRTRISREARTHHRHSISRHHQRSRNVSRVPVYTVVTCRVRERIPHRPTAVWCVQRTYNRFPWRILGTERESPEPVVESSPWLETGKGQLARNGGWPIERARSPPKLGKCRFSW